mgnify:CR=1 FL=1
MLRIFPSEGLKRRLESSERIDSKTHICQWPISSSSESLTSSSPTTLSHIFQNAVGPAGPCGSKSLSNHVPTTPRCDRNPPTCTPSLRHRSSPLSQVSNNQPTHIAWQLRLPVKHRYSLPSDFTIRCKSHRASDLRVRIWVPCRIY